MHPKRFALIGGIIMLAMGAISLIPSLVGSSVNLIPLNLNESYGLFLGMFPMNIVNKIVLIAFGIGGIYASMDEATNLPKSILFSRLTFVVMGAAAILGLFPQTYTMGGYWPLYGNEVYSHALFAVLGAYYGFALRAKMDKDTLYRRVDQPTATSGRPARV